MRQISAADGYGRTERARLEWPSQIRPPFFTALARATSSIKAPRTVSIPPIRCNARRLIRMVPPAAAGWAMLAGSYLPTLQRFGCSPLWAAVLPLIAVFYMAATVGSAANHYLGRGVAWKGRAYQGAGQ